MTIQPHPSDDECKPAAPIKQSPYFSGRGRGGGHRGSRARKAPKTSPYPTSHPVGFPSASTSSYFRPHPPLCPPKNLNVRSDQENSNAAELFRQALGDDDGEGADKPAAEEPSRPPRSQALGKTHFEDLFADQFGVSRRHLRSLSHVDDDVEEKEVVTENHLLIGQQPYKPVKSSESTVMYATQVLQPSEEDISEVHHGRTTTLFLSEAGCDIPMARSDDTPLPSVSFEPDLPPLAATHPTRVWNSMLHSLAPELQPLIKWKYDKMDKDDCEEAGWIAYLTLILPPTHPAVVEHPLFYVLSKDRYSPEYIAAMEVIGAMKTWKGQIKKAKTEAQNSALLRCIADNALAWVLRPKTLSVPECEAPSPEPASPKPFPILLQPGIPLDHRLDIPATLVTIADEIVQFSSTRRISGLLEFEVDENTGLYGAKLTVGAPPNVQCYLELCNHLKSEDAAEAVCKKALDLHVLGFLQWLRGEEENSLSHDLQKAPVSAVRSTLKSLDDAVDWTHQLDHFCKISGLEGPLYSQRATRRDNRPTVFVGLATIEHESFETNNLYETIKAARQAVARQIFVEHFGQDPIDL